MRLRGWERKYGEILSEFGFSRKGDLRAAEFLDSLLGTKVPLDGIDRKIRGRTVFVVGAGPSLSSSLKIIRKFNAATIIAADGATRALLEKGIKPDIVVTDLDGNLEYLRKASKMNSLMVVHSHADNIGLLPAALLFKNCIGTTEARPFGKIRNFGGFTDGDRCVFLARYFGAKNVVLFGMDFGGKIGRYSKERTYDRRVKVAKLAKAKSLLEWLASKGGPGFYTMSEPLSGFEKIGPGRLHDLFRART
ncbi:MAG TPA: 6-hydroxymethylpterin diphosphokinase MptE-like protein [Candidatus Nitrosotalea sp.]|nr:6-hydroxymethylpterin diphosphokinase MptE-like protein [Candidatus Nitrosotalea sp.]